MKQIRPITTTVALQLSIITIALLLGVGCGNQIPKLTSEESKSFESAPPEVKQTWDKALAADKANDYVTAQTALDGLSQMILSDQQKKALEIESGAFAVRLWQAAEKNDPAAIKAVQAINKSKDRRK